MVKKEYNVIKPVGLKPRPDKYEESIAELMAKYFKSDVRFIKRASTTTPDVVVLRYNQQWEIKNIRGNSKRTIQNNLRTADNQSENIIIGLSRTKMTTKQAEGRINEFLRTGSVKIRRILLVTKKQIVLVIK
ncbi:hypothetical protein FWF48_01985 [Candidatus Saccharibacteria bacterium]|nr:hypothetical protein [Candidatus Saccharibacteria bacterium]